MLLAAFCIASSASADLLYTRQDQSYANTALGIIQGDGAPVSPLVSNLGGNQGQGIYHGQGQEERSGTPLALSYDKEVPS